MGWQQNDGAEVDGPSGGARAGSGGADCPGSGARQAVQALSSQLAERERAILTLSAQMSEQVAEKDRALKSLSTKHGDLKEE